MCVRVPFGYKRRATQALLSMPVWEGAQIACRPSGGPAGVWLSVRPRGGAYKQYAGPQQSPTTRPLLGTSRLCGGARPCLQTPRARS